MRATWVLPWFAMFTGCSVLCGPTVYHLSGITATTTFPGEWDRATALRGLEALNATAGQGTECSLSGQGNGTRIEVNGCSRGQVELRVSYPLEPAIEGERERVEEVGDDIMSARSPDVEEMVAAFQAATGWSGASSTHWDKGMMHGDC